jgi:hypothetical protein
MPAFDVRPFCSPSGRATRGYLSTTPRSDVERTGCEIWEAFSPLNLAQDFFGLALNNPIPGLAPWISAVPHQSSQAVGLNIPRSWPSIDTSDAEALRRGWKPLSLLRHQWTGMAKLVHCGMAAIPVLCADSVGTGKTLTTIVTMIHFSNMRDHYKIRQHFPGRLLGGWQVYLTPTNDSYPCL